jgi:hypothetical protein
VVPPMPHNPIEPCPGSPSGNRLETPGGRLGGRLLRATLVTGLQTRLPTVGGGDDYDECPPVARLRSVAALVLERHLDLGPVRLDLPAL